MNPRGLESWLWRLFDVNTYEIFVRFPSLGVVFGGPEGLSFEPFLPWIQKIMIAYEDQKDNSEGSLMGLIDTKNRKSYVVSKMKN